MRLAEPPVKMGVMERRQLKRHGFCRSEPTYFREVAHVDQDELRRLQGDLPELVQREPAVFRGDRDLVESPWNEKRSGPGWGGGVGISVPVATLAAGSRSDMCHPP